MKKLLTERWLQLAGMELLTESIEGTASGDISEWATLLVLQEHVQAGTGMDRAMADQLIAIIEQCRVNEIDATAGEAKINEIVKPKMLAAEFVVTKLDESHVRLLENEKYDMLIRLVNLGFSEAGKVIQHIATSELLKNGNTTAVITKVIDTARLGSTTTDDLRVLLSTPAPENTTMQMGGFLYAGYSQKVGGSNAGAINGGLNTLFPGYDHHTKDLNEEFRRAIKEAYPNKSLPETRWTKEIVEASGVNYLAAKDVGEKAMIKLLQRKVAGQSEVIKNWFRMAMQRSQGVHQFLLEEKVSVVTDESLSSYPHTLMATRCDPEQPWVLDCYRKEGSKTLYICDQSKRVIGKWAASHSDGPGATFPSLRMQGNFPKNPKVVGEGWTKVAAASEHAYVQPPNLEDVPLSILDNLGLNAAQKATINSAEGDSPYTHGKGSDVSIFDRFKAKAPSKDVFNNRDWARMSTEERTQLTAVAQAAKDARDQRAAVAAAERLRIENDKYLRSTPKWKVYFKTIPTRDRPALINGKKSYVANSEDFRTQFPDVTAEDLGKPTTTESKKYSITSRLLGE